MIDRPVAVRVLQECAKGKQLGYVTIRKTDVSAAIAYMIDLERRLQEALPEWAKEEQARVPWDDIIHVVRYAAMSESQSIVTEWLVENGKATIVLPPKDPAFDERDDWMAVNALQDTHPEPDAERA